MSVQISQPGQARARGETEMKPTYCQFREWRHVGRADFAPGNPAPPSNSRLAHCRLCGSILAVGKARGYTEFLTNLYTCGTRYICIECEELTR